MTISPPIAHRPDPAPGLTARQRRLASVLAAVLAVHALGLWALLAGQSDPPELPVPGEVVTTALLLPEPASAAAPAAPARPVAAKPQPVKPQAKPAQQPPTAQPLPTPSAPARSQLPAALPAAVPAQAPSSQAPAGAALAAPASQANAASASTVAGSAAAASPAPARIELPSSSADYLNNPRPAYPPLSKRLGEEGKVVLRVLIEADGSASKAEIRSSSGYDRLDQAALQTVLRWRYLPGKRGGVPEAMWFNVPINFVLE